MSEIRNAGRVLPYFTNFCVSLRFTLLILPLIAIAYCLWLWLHREERASQWTGFIVGTMAVMIVFVLPAMSTSFLLMIDQVKVAVGSH
jgi:hypothetical protein